MRRITRAFAVVLSFALIFTAFPISVFAGGAVAAARTGVPQPVVSVPVSLHPDGIAENIPIAPGDILAASCDAIPEVLVQPGIQAPPSSEQTIFAASGEAVALENVGARVHVGGGMPVATPKDKALLGRFKNVFGKWSGAKINWDNAAQQRELNEPPTSKNKQVDDYYGARVPDPYRWLEDPRTPQTHAWVAAQNRASAAFLKGSPTRERVLALLDKLGRSPYRKLPVKYGAYYVVARRVKGLEQPVLYKSRRLYGSSRVLLDPNKLSRNGVVAVADISFSRDGKYMAYALSSKGSDWRTWRIRDVATGKDLPDVLRWTKFESVAWRSDGDGFYYYRFERPPPGLEYVASTTVETRYFHSLGTPQSRDLKDDVVVGKRGLPAPPLKKPALKYFMVGDIPLLGVFEKCIVDGSKLHTL